MLRTKDIDRILRQAGFPKAERILGADEREGMTEGFSVRHCDEYIRVDYTPATNHPSIDEATDRRSRNIALINYRAVIEELGFKGDMINKGLIRYLRVSEKQQERKR